jgi:hypothetical protein
MRLFCSIATFTLNASNLDIARIANEMGFLNPVAGPTLAQDMRRGSFRQIIALKLIVGPSNWTKGEGKDHLPLVLSDPYKLIIQSYKVYFGFKLMDATRFGLLPFLQLLKTYEKWYPDYRILSESISYNRWRISGKPAGELEFSNLKLMGLILGEDGSVIDLPNRPRIDSLKIFEEYLPVMSNLENTMRGNPSKKFFMPYEDILSHMR